MFNNGFLSWRQLQTTRVESDAISRSLSLQRLNEHMAAMSDTDHIDNFRIDIRGIQFLSAKLNPDLQPSTSAGISTENQIKIALMFFATGNSLQSLSSCFHVAPSTVYKIIIKVSTALSNIISDFVNFPKCDELDKILSIITGFWEYSKFPNCLGVVDGTQIQIKAPEINEEVFVNRKGHHSLNVQIVCSINLDISHCVIKWPGSVHDSTVWSSSSICYELNNMYLNVDGWLLGDSGYPLRERLMVPFTDPVTPGQRAYNSALKRSRSAVERCIGVLKSRWRCLDGKDCGGLQFQPETCCKIIASCISLHNYCIKRGMVGDILPHIRDELQNEGNNENDHQSSSHGQLSDRALLSKGKQCRLTIVQRYFD